MKWSIFGMVLCGVILAVFFPDKVKASFKKTTKKGRRKLSAA